MAGWQRQGGGFPLEEIRMHWMAVEVFYLMEEKETAEPALTDQWHLCALLG